MMWGKRKPIAEGDTRKRCQYEVRRSGCFKKCGRLAKAYDISVDGRALATMDLCSQHVRTLVNDLHVAAQRRDGRRRKAAAVQL